MAYASMQTKLGLVAMVDRGALLPNEWRETLNASIEVITAIFVREIQRGQTEGSFRQDLNVHFTAQTIWATFLAGALNWTIVHPELDYHKLADDLASFALAGLYSQEVVCQ